MEADVYEFYYLGIGDPIPVSASNHQGVGDLLEAVSDHFKKDGSESDDDDRPRIAIVGRPNVGKSTLFKVIAGDYNAIV